MKSIRDTFKKTGTLHHAYLLEGERETVRAKLLDFIQYDIKHKIQGNPDFWNKQYETFSIDDARELRDIQALKAFVNNRKIFVIETIFMTVEAQNSLLKIFEEPTPHTHFFIILPSQEVVLPTLRSRLFIVKNTDQNEDKNSLTIATEFLALSIRERLEKISALVEEKDKMQAITLIDTLIKAICMRKDKKSSKNTLEELLKVRMYLNDRSPSLKLLLEHTALIVS